MKATEANLSERLRRYVRALAKDDDLAEFFRKVGGSGEVYVFGGAPRDVVFSGKHSVNDLDLFVSGRLAEGELASLGSDLRRTNFGGYRFRLGRYDIDIWELEKSHAFVASASYVSVMNLLKTVCFSTDAIAVSVGSGKIVKSPRFDASFGKNLLDFVVPPNRYDPVVGCRIARLTIKLGLELSPSVASYFIRCVEDFGVPKLIDMESRWREKRILNEIAIEEVRSRIEFAVEKVFNQLRSGVHVLIH